MIAEDNQQYLSLLTGFPGQGAASSTELTAFTLREAGRLQSELHFLTELMPDQAMEMAEAIDRQGCGAEVRRRPLHGIPLAHKDMFDRPGRRCSYGSRIPQEREPAWPAASLRALEDSGSVTIGFLNMSEFALGPTGFNATFGHCRNPWNPRKMSGGSSSGSAAAVAARLVMGSLASDTGGSIRIPASCCGVTGMKPTQALIDRAGTLPLSPSLDCLGLIAASAEVVSHLLRAVSHDRLRGTVALEPTSMVFAFPASGLEHVAEPIVAALEDAARALEEAGLAVVKTNLPDLSKLDALANQIQRPESLVVHGERLRSHRDQYSPAVLQRIEIGRDARAVSYLEAVRQRPRWRQKFATECLGTAAVLLIPTLGFTVPDLVDVDIFRPDDPTGLAYAEWTRWINYLDLPAISLPIGFDRAGLPIGMQIVGRHNDDRTVLEAAALFQRITDWHARLPPARADWSRFQ